ncbi:MAG TPA: hypothetical protein PJ995_21605 [Cyclobacteriaceae bacterium]|nr:hypothetical protein [Chitinophagales bacterium]HMX02948.1 hypothetical protein [Cyclobacteriaceae bacterium]
MKTTAKIKIPKDHEIDTVDKGTGMVTFRKKPADILSLTTISSVVAYLGEKDPDVIDYSKLAKVFNADHHLVNYHLCCLIVKALNEKRTPDWNNNNQTKWTLWFFMGGSGGFRFLGYDDWHSASVVCSRLCFMEKRLGEHATKQPEFFNAFKKFMTY